jgi:hypothetical protein
MYNLCSTLVFQTLTHYLRRGSSCAEFLSRNSFHFASSSRRSTKFPSGLESQFVQRLQYAGADHRTGQDTENTGELRNKHSQLDTHFTFTYTLLIHTSLSLTLY